MTSTAALAALAQTRNNNTRSYSPRHGCALFGFSVHDNVKRDTVRA